MLTRKVIRPSTSPWRSNIVLIRKPDNSWRFAIDLRAVNRVMKKSKQPIPTIDELLDKLHGTKYFSVIDLKSGYWHIKIKESDKCKTAFVANGKLYEFNAMVYGLCNAPGSFQACISYVLQDLPNTICYLDDVLLYSQTEQEHQQQLDALLCRLNNYNLKISIKKCQLFKKDTPSSTKEVQRFLGFCAFHHKFLKSLSQMGYPLYQLLRKDKRFHWSPECQRAFDNLKQAIAKLPTLAYPDPQLIYDLHVDASIYGLGAVLIQNGRPIAFTSRSLTPAEKNYSVTELECLRRLARWILTLQAYEFNVVHRKGVDNAAPDALSRQFQNNQDSEALTFESFRSYQKEDPFIKSILQQGIKTPFIWYQDLLFRKQENKPTRPVLPRKMIHNILHAAHNNKTVGHFGVEKTIEKA
ncbi:hypothetical protein INT45_002994 [Circinella minor]|uniref:Reverse transcriptase domain-containing protein n=1 Tax=Circinella minor TaxID=1195481 RepID=A0A8H7VDS5_9FUNG|nr:hypothetical protein INT45_002994 [Circinella minor]